MARKKTKKKKSRKSRNPRKSPTLSRRRSLVAAIVPTPTLPTMEQVTLDALRIAYDRVNRGDYRAYIQSALHIDENAYTLTLVPSRTSPPSSILLIDDPQIPIPSAPRGGPITFIN